MPFIPRSSSSFSAVRAVLFDIDDTLFPSSEFSSQARKKAVAAMIRAGLEATPKAALSELSKIVKSKGSNFSGHFNILVRRFPSASPLRAAAAGVAAYHAHKRLIKPYPGTASTLAKLSSRGFTLAIASEGVEIKQWDKLILLGLDDCFNAVFVTAPKGKTPAFYRAICLKLGLPPAAVLMVGDHPEKDMAAARAAGLRTVRLRQGRYQKTPSAADLDVRSLSQLLRFLPIRPI